MAEVKQPQSDADNQLYARLLDSEYDVTYNRLLKIKNDGKEYGLTAAEVIKFEWTASNLFITYQQALFNLGSTDEVADRLKGLAVLLMRADKVIRRDCPQVLFD